MPGNRASLPPRRACQDGNAEDPGLGATHGGLPGPKCRESGPGCYLQRPFRTKMPGIRAWVLSTEAFQDQNAGNQGLGRVCRDLPGPKCQESGPGRYLQRPPRTGMPGNWSWLTSAAPGTIRIYKMRARRSSSQGCTGHMSVKDLSKYSPSFHTDRPSRPFQERLLCPCFVNPIPETRP
jgi:hypothetical protein